MNAQQLPIPSVKDRVSAEEWQMRVDLAACYRKVAHLGWDDLIFTHISARVPGPDRHFLLNPYGMMFGEVTASSLVKVDMAGNKVTESLYEINPAGFTIHSAVHEARDDAHCVIHLHTNAGVAVACQRDGLLPISQHALIALASLAYHDYEGLALNPDEKARLQAHLGKHHALILRNHGLLTCGRSVAAAFLVMFNLERACQMQVLSQAGGAPLRTIAPEILALVKEQMPVVLRGQGAELTWPAVLRDMDRLDPSYRS
jgi:ribulose-5-phosphate 4-epimerase/fuculose-1-phosphate aldolase